MVGVTPFITTTTTTTTKTTTKPTTTTTSTKKATAAISWPLRVVKGRRDGDGGVITDTVTPSALAMDGPTDRLMERSTHPLIEIQGCIHKYNKQN